jgi:hypothetical protein
MRTLGLALLFVLGLGACGGGSAAVGTYEPDFSAAATGMGAEELKMMKEMMKMELVLKSDNTFTMNATMMTNKTTSSGTWSLAGDRLTMRKLEEDGKKEAQPEEKVATYKDGTISMTDAGKTMVFKRK